MTNEIHVVTGLQVKSPASTQIIHNTVSRTTNVTRTGEAAARGTASIGFAAHEAIPLGDVTTLAWAEFANHDTTNYVEIGTDVAAAFVPFLRLNAGERCVCRLSAAIAPYAKANTAAVNLEYHIFQN